MLCKEVRHTGITVTDMNEAVEYWTFMGFSIFDKGKAYGRFAKAITGKPVHIEWVKMTHEKDCTMIELIKYEPDIGVPFHIALTVKDIGQFGVKNPGIDACGRKIKYVKWGDLTLEVVQE